MPRKSDLCKIYTQGKDFFMDETNFEIKPQPSADNYIANLFAVLTRLTPNQLMLLYGDLLTETEAEKLAKRLAIARGLLAGQSYQQIQKALGVTANTVTQIQRVLKSAGHGFRSAANWLAVTGNSAEQELIFKEQPRPSVAKFYVDEPGQNLLSGAVKKLFHSSSRQ